MKRRDRQRGTTLAELAAGIAFVAIALVGTIAAITSGSSLAKSTAETREANRVATSLIEEMRAADIDELVSTYHGTSRALDGVGSASSGAADIVVQRLDNGTSIWAVYEVTVLVRWARAGTPRVIEMKSLVSDRAFGSGLSQPVVEASDAL